MKTTLQVPIDKKLKENGEKVAESFGFSSLQELVRVFLKQMTTGKVVPTFSIADEFLTSEQEAVLTEKYLGAKEEIDSGHGFTSRSTKELIEQLDSE